MTDLLIVALPLAFVAGMFTLAYFLDKGWLVSEIDGSIYTVNACPDCGNYRIRENGFCDLCKCHPSRSKDVRK